MASDDASLPGAPPPDLASDNARGRRGRAPVALPAGLETVHHDYAVRLDAAAMPAGHTQAAYASRVRQFLASVADGHTDGDPLADPHARDGAVRDWRTHLQTVATAAPATVNLSLATVTDFYTRTGRGQVHAERMPLTRRAPKALSPKNGVRWLRAVERRTSTRDRLIGLIPFYAGLRTSELAALDVDDVHLSARKAAIEVRSGKGRRARTVPVHHALRQDLRIWLHDDERATWNPTNPGLLVNSRGRRIGPHGLHDVIGHLADDAHLKGTTAHTLRHTFTTNLIRRGIDVVTVTDLMGHARPDTTRDYTRPTADDLNRTVQTLPYNK